MPNVHPAETARIRAPVARVSDTPPLIALDPLDLPHPSKPAVALADPDGRLLQVSVAFAALLEMEPGELRGRRAVDLTHLNDRSELLRTIGKLQAHVSNHICVDIRYVTRTQRARRCLTTLHALRNRNDALICFLLRLQTLGPPEPIALPKSALTAAA